MDSDPIIFSSRICRRPAFWAVFLSGMFAFGPSSFGAESRVTGQLYRIAPGDELEVRVFDEPDLSDHHRVDSNGEVRLALIGTVAVAGMTLRQAEERVEFLYVENRILKKPMVTVRVNNYAVREVTVVGQVQNQGTLGFPPEVNSMDVVDVIAKSGGFTPRARPAEVAIIRVGPDGEETKTIVNVDALMHGEPGKSEPVPILPGDKILVPPMTW